MELFEEIVLTLLMMYIGIKKAIAVTKQIQQNAAVIAARQEIEQKSRSLDIHKTSSITSTQELKQVSNVNHQEINSENYTSKLSKIDIPWPKDIIDEDVRILRCRTPSVSEVLTEDSEEILNIQGDKNKITNETFKLNDNSTERSSENVIQEDKTELKVDENKSNSPKEHYPTFNETEFDKSAIDKNETNILISSDTKIIINLDENISSKTINEVLNESSENDDISKSSSEISDVNPTKSVTGEESIKDKTSSKNENTVLLKNGEINSNFLSVYDESNIETINETEKKELTDDSSISESVDSDKTLITETSKSNSYDEVDSNSEFETAADSVVDSKIVNSKVPNSKESNHSCVGSNKIDKKSYVNINTADVLNKTNDSVQSVKTKSDVDNRIYLRSAKCTREKNLHNHLSLNDSVVIGNSGSGRKIHRSSSGEEEIFYNATSEENKPFWLIFSGEYTKAMNKDWHSGHFCCWQCDESLTGQRYVLRDDHPYCIKCYESVFANPCEECNKIIGIDSKDLSYKDKHWHEACFLCKKCHVSLVDKQFGSKGEKIYCGNCYDTQFASRCDGCNQIFRAVETTTTETNMATDVLSNKLESLKLTTKTVGEERIKEAKKKDEDVAILSTFLPGQAYKGFYCTLGKDCFLTDPKRTPPGTKKMEYKTRQWHEQCFACCVCKSPIGTKSFIPREQEIYCATCYEEKFATRCVKCNKIITSGGVTYKNEPWHRECFTCTNCNTSLAGQRFTSRDEKPYCADCFGELFAKRCTACCKPITGIGGTRFISFEDRHWHNDCFICATCKTSLVGRGFITDGDDIICPDCAKAKLM